MVADLYHFNADPDPASNLNADPDPAFHFNADPDPHLYASLQRNIRRWSEMVKRAIAQKVPNHNACPNAHLGKHELVLANYTNFNNFSRQAHMVRIRG
jgi:hypothetical protein